MAMREKYTQPGAKIHYYLVEWDADKLSWEGFRNSVRQRTVPRTHRPCIAPFGPCAKSSTRSNASAAQGRRGVPMVHDSYDLAGAQVLGSTDPTIVAEGSLRRSIFNDWKKLGLATEPNVGDNGVHASASPFEALCERLNWVGESP